MSQEYVHNVGEDMEIDELVELLYEKERPGQNKLINHPNFLWWVTLIMGNWQLELTVGQLILQLVCH